MDKRVSKPRPITREWLFRAAAHYLERYASSTENLRRVLERKVRRRALALEADPGQHRELIEETVAKFIELKLLDDRTFAENRLASLRRRGASSRQAAARLMVKGVGRELVETVLAEDRTSDEDAAIAYARRRRLGPYRLRDRAERRDRDIAAMMRAGFSFPDAAAAIDAEAPDE